MLASCNTEKKRIKCRGCRSYSCFCHAGTSNFQLEETSDRNHFFCSLNNFELIWHVFFFGGGVIFLTFKTSWPNVKGNTKRLFKKDKEKKVFFFSAVPRLFCLPQTCHHVRKNKQKTPRGSVILSLFVLNARLHILQSLL